jgi:hypothetical protein
MSYPDDGSNPEAKEIPRPLLSASTDAFWGSHSGISL